MTNENWELNWHIYTTYEEIKPNNAVTTYFLNIRTDTTTFEKIKNWLSEKELQVEPIDLDGSGDSIYYNVQTKDQSKIVTLSDFEEYVVVNCLNDKARELIINLINSVKSEIKRVVELSHKEENFNIHDSELNAISRTGFTKNKEGDYLPPKTFYKFFKGEEIVAIMLLEYFNFEMGDCAPTIMMIEVADQYRGLGYGKKILKNIECNLKDRGFRRIWSSDTKSEWFWKKMGYHIDIDEGYHDLTRIKC